MQINWYDYLEIARYPENNNNYLPEAGKRSAVSRAYYAAFCHARNYAIQKGEKFNPKKENVHQKVIKYFEREGMSDVARDLKYLRDWRNDCDYEDQLINTHILISMAIPKAENIFRVLACQTHYVNPTTDYNHKRRT